ncbi:hypothetical protein BJ742DRAFT_783007 [Cladochytrium replicatum]|nr:hypothetical protein BJ742DRAFT_783007 [Cladochytrium replicatum]
MAFNRHSNGAILPADRSSFPTTPLSAPSDPPTLQTSSNTPRIPHVPEIRNGVPAPKPFQRPTPNAAPTLIMDRRRRSRNLSTDPDPFSPEKSTPSPRSRRPAQLQPLTDPVDFVLTPLESVDIRTVHSSLKRFCQRKAKRRRPSAQPPQNPEAASPSSPSVWLRERTAAAAAQDEKSKLGTVLAQAEHADGGAWSEATEGSVASSDSRSSSRRPSAMAALAAVAAAAGVNAEMSRVQNGLGIDFKVWDWSEPELYGIIMGLFIRMGLVYHQDELDFLLAFIVDVAKSYSNNPYHSFYHAVDVCYMLFYMLHDLGAAECLALNSDEVFALLIAGLGHDALHPGFNNLFQVNAHTEVAQRFQNTSVLENQSRVFIDELLTKHQLLERLAFLRSRRPFKYSNPGSPASPTIPDVARAENIRVIISEAIISTDMVFHFSMLEGINAIADECLRDFPGNESESGGEELCDDEDEYDWEDEDEYGSDSSEYESEEQVDEVKDVEREEQIIVDEIVEESAEEICLKEHISKRLQDNEPARRKMINLLLHAADISNAARPLSLCRKWAQLVAEEFFLQGDQERRLHLPVSPNMERTNTNQAQMGLEFNDIIARPFFELLSDLVPRTAIFVDMLLGNRNHWLKLFMESRAPAPNPILEKTPINSPTAALHASVINLRNEQMLRMDVQHQDTGSVGMTADRVLIAPHPTIETSRSYLSGISASTSRLSALRLSAPDATNLSLYASHASPLTASSTADFAAISEASLERSSDGSLGSLTPSRDGLNSLPSTPYTPIRANSTTPGIPREASPIPPAMGVSRSSTTPSPTPPLFDRGRRRLSVAAGTIEIPDHIVYRNAGRRSVVPAMGSMSPTVGSPGRSVGQKDARLKRSKSTRMVAEREVSLGKGRSLDNMDL